MLRGNLFCRRKYNPNGALLSVDEMYYDGNQNLIQQLSTVFPEGKIVATKWRYDLLDRLIELQEAAGTSLQRTTRYTYTPKGHLLQTIKEKWRCYRKWL